MTLTDPASVDPRIARNPKFAAFEASRQGFFRTPSFAIIVFGLVLVVIGAVLTREDWTLQGSISLTLAIGATGLGLALGLAGEYVLNIAFVFAVGAYTTGVLMVTFGWNYWLALLVGTIAGAIVGLGLSLIGLRVSNFYFGMLGFFMVLLVTPIVGALQPWTNGTSGVVTITALPSLFGLKFNANGLFILCAIALTLGLLFVNNIRSSPLGIQMRRMRDAPRMLATTGTRVWRIRFSAYLITSLLAGLGGALYSDLSGILLPGQFDFNMTTVILAAVIVGGSRTLIGPAVGVIVLWIVPRVLFDIQGWTDILYGAVMLVAVLLFRGGVVEWVQERWKLLRKQRSNQAVAAAADEPGRRSVDALVDLLLPLRSLDGRRTLRATGVVKHYGGVRALDFEEGDEFDVATGEVHLLLGPNGSGKTTLLNALNGLVRVAGGTVALDGESINRKPVAAIARAGIARSFQSPALPDEVTPAELFTTAILAMQRIGYFHWVLSDAKANRARRQSRGLALRLAATSGLAAVADTPCSALTSGQRRMVDVLQALLSDSAIVLLDEPAAGLSDDEREHLSATVKALARRGLGFVVVEHDLELALSFADRVTVMADGRPVAHGQPDEILSRDIVKTVLIGTTS